jgi:ethanolamine utilization microcompartment shell protein EutS
MESFVYKDILGHSGMDSIIYSEVVYKSVKYSYGILDCFTGLMTLYETLESSKPIAVIKLFDPVSV